MHKFALTTGRPAWKNDILVDSPGGILSGFQKFQAHGPIFGQKSRRFDLYGGSDRPSRPPRSAIKGRLCRTESISFRKWFERLVIRQVAKLPGWPLRKFLLYFLLLYFRCTFEYALEYSL